MKKKYLTHVVWLLIAIAMFIGGMYYGKASSSSAAGSRGFGGGAFSSSTRSAFGGGRSGNGGGFVAGTISAIDPQSITLQLPNGNSEVVFYSTSTQVIKPSPASIGDLAVGTNVTIGGTTNSDGSLTAQSIQVRPSTTSGFGGPRTGQ